MGLLTEIGLGQSQNAKKIEANLNMLKNERGHYKIINSIDGLQRISKDCSILLYISTTAKDTELLKEQKLFENKVLPKVNVMVKNKNIIIAWTDTNKNNIS